MIKLIIFDFNQTLFDPSKGELYPGAKQLIEKLSEKYVLSLVSYGGSQRAEQLRQLGLLPCFKKVILTANKTKQDYLQAIKDLGVRHSQVLVVGDRLEEEIKIGNELGMQTLWLPKPDYFLIFERLKKE